MLADSGASDHFVNELIPRLHQGVREYKKLEEPRPTETSGNKELATATGTQDRRTHGLQSQGQSVRPGPVIHPCRGIPDTVNAGMLIVGFTPTQSDPSVYTPGSGDTFVILTLYFTRLCRHLDRRKGRGRT